jgi:hypothetical protein
MYYGEGQQESFPLVNYCKKNKALYDLVSCNKELQNIIRGIALQCISKNITKFENVEINDKGILTCRIM